MVDTLKALGIDIVLCIAGFVGSLIAVGKQAVVNVKSTIVAIAAGVGCANYLTPLIISMFKLEDPRWQTGLAFILGNLGLKGVEIISTKLMPFLHKKTEEPKS